MSGVRTETFTFEGHTATVIRPQAPTGAWIWKTEFLYAFDRAECALSDLGYTRVYLQISDRYGSDAAVRCMHRFHAFVTEKYGLSPKTILFGFSRGGLYAFNYALFYPESVEKIYLDAPVLDVNTWPREGTVEREQLYRECSLDATTIRTFAGNPIGNLEEFFAHRIPLLVVAGGADEVVPFPENAGRLLAYADAHGFAVERVIKPTCGHHPHSLEDLSPILSFVCDRT